VTARSGSPQIDVGDNTQAGASPGLPNILLLGQTNAFFADSVAVGRGKSYVGGGSSMLFNSSFANPVAYFRGTNGSASRVGTWTIGDAWGAKTVAQNFGTNDFSGGTVDALVDQMFVGRGASTANLSGANVVGNGTLIFTAGTFDVNTLEVGYAQTVAGNGTVNVNGGALVVNTNLELAHGSGSVGTLNISNATATANVGIAVGGGTATIILNSATLNTTNSAATIGTGGSSVSTFAITNSTLKLATQSLSPASTVTTLECDGANTINISSVPLIGALPAQFPLIQYSASAGNLASFTLGTLPSSSPAYVGYISNNTANSSVDLVITSGPIFYPLVWDGASSGDWDINLTANWRSNGVATTYQQGYLVVQFDDTLTGTANVNLTTTLTPGSIKVNNSLSNYTFSGTGRISGAASLDKAGTGTLTLAENGGNDFIGGVTVNGGTLQVGTGGTSGKLGAGSVTLATNTTLTFSRSDNLTVSNLISGAGTLTKNGANILTLGGPNLAFSGEILVAQGTLRAGNALALGTVAGGTTIGNGATLDVNGQKFNNAELITVSGAGVGGTGAIVNNATNNVTQALRVVTLTGSTTFGGFSDWDIHSSGNSTSDAALNTSDNTNKVTKVGTNTVTLFGVQVDSNLGDIDVQAGALSVERNTTGLGNPVNTITVFTNATLQFQNASNIWNKVVVLKGGGTLRAVNGNEFAGPVTLESGVGTFSVGTGGSLKLDNVISGAGGLTKTGAGSLSLASASAYAGATLVSAGTLVLIDPGSIDSSTNITLSAGTTLDLSALADPTLTLTSGRSLTGSGTVFGNITMASGSTLVVGGPGTNTIGTLTITSNLILQAGSTNLMEISRVGGITNNDQIVATNVTYGGTLTVTGTGGAFVAGDTFKLFAAVSYGGSFSATNLPVGVIWDTSNLSVNGTIKVVSVTGPQITGITSTNNGSFNLAFSGPAGNNYSVWASTNLAATPINTAWTLLVSNGLFNVNGNAAFIDTTATNYPMRFYLISVP
jgi:fibronectin-binding autotransporter adhesin